MNIQVPLEQAPRSTGGMPMSPLMPMLTMSANLGALGFASMSQPPRKMLCSSKRKVGSASAARVSRGTEFDTWDGLTVEAPKRGHKEHITVTVVIYNTVLGGVPSEADVIAAIDDLEQLYASCTNGRLAEDKFDFMKEGLTVHDANKISKKIKTQPYPGPVLGFNTFP